jgi:lipopolysaccharide export system protein LptA
MRHTSILTLLTLSLTITSLAVAQPKPAAPQPGSGPLDQKAFDDSFGKLPTNVSADSLSFNPKNRVFAYQGNVIVTQGDMKLTSKTLEGNYSEANQLQKLIARGDVLITKQDIKASGQTATYDAPAGIVILTDNPQLAQNESILTADRIKIFINENRSQAEGDVRVTFVQSSTTGLNPMGGMGLAAQNASTTPQPTATPKITPTPPGEEKGSATSASSASEISSTPGPTPTPTKAATKKSSKTTSTKKQSTTKPKGSPTKQPAK